MPIDIWNCHAYVAVGSMNPDRVINEFIEPFRQYTHTVENGLYANSELWVTEFGVAIWSTPLDPSYISEYIQQIGPRLERHTDRFFWFIGPWPGNWDPSMNDTALLGATGAPTLIGQTYAGLARTYPNPLPPPAPSQQPFPAAVFPVNCDFQGGASPWRVVAGDWTLDAGTYRQTSLTKSTGISFLPYDYRDVRVECDIRINATSGSNTTYWAGVTLRGGWIWDDADNITYLVFLRKSGELSLYTRADGVIATVRNAVTDTSVFHRLRAEVVGGHFKIALDGVTRIECDDPHARRVFGKVMLRSYLADCSFDNVSVIPMCAADFDGDADVDLTDFAIFQFCFGGPNRPIAYPECDVADLDADNDVDLSDFAVFQRCFNGPNQPPPCPWRD
jgi:hypothetical protein